MSTWSLRDVPPPSAAVEITADHISAASVNTRGDRPAITAHATEPLPADAVAPSLTAQNIHNRTAVAEALGRVLDHVGRPRRVALIIPDPVTKVSLVRFEHVPPRAQDLEQLIRWQMRKAAPFPIEEAQISYVPGAQTPEGQEFIVSLARADVIREYESLCEAAGAHAGIVDTSTFNVVNAVLAGSPPGPVDWLLVNVASDYTSVVILRGPEVLFYRSRSADAEGTLADLVHQTAMYYQNRLSGSGFDRVLLCGASAGGGRQAGDVEQVRRNLQDRLGSPVETVAARMAVSMSDRITAAPALMDAMAPLVGVLVRGRGVAA